MLKNEEIIEAIKVFVRTDDEPPVESAVPEEEEAVLRAKIVTKQPNIKIKIEKPLTIFLKIRKAINGDYMIYDHPLYDIVIMPNKNKILTFSKKAAKFEPYPSQDKFFDYLARRGLLALDSVQGGNIFGSLEAKYPINDEVDTIETLLLVIYDFLQDEIKDIKNILRYDDEVEGHYTEPEDKDSTELGEIPHKEKKGSMDPGYQPYGLLYRI
tara:strand:+ start:88 stop:723 length:636 start_codon:yes stop_codon:yes gene_type:complete